MWRLGQAQLIRALLGSLVAATWVSPAWGQTVAPKRAVYLDVRGRCPDRETVASELQSLLKLWEFSEDADAAEEVARVVDRGPLLEISVLGDLREIADPESDCQERARVAAVFIALRLEPAEVPQQEPKSPEPEKEEREPEPPPPKRGTELGLDGGLLVQRSLDGPLGFTFGPLMGLRLSRAAALAYLRVSAQSPSTTQIEGIDLRFSWVPVQLGVGYQLSLHAWTVAPTLGVSAEFLRVRAEDLEGAGARGRVEMGPNLAVRVARRMGPVSVFGAASFSWFPRPYIVEAEPLGELMRTPAARAGVAFGLSTDWPSR